MKRVNCQERPGWKDKAEQLGFVFHTMYGQPYWDETAYYSFTLRQIEDDLEDPTEELHQMALDTVDRVIRSEEWLEKLAIPESFHQLIQDSRDRGDPSLYGRFDLAYSGEGPAKMLEYNADTPTSLYESAYFQWIWLEDKISDGSFPESTDQFNSVQDKLIDRLRAMFPEGAVLHCAAAADVIEDRQTVRYLEDCASQAGLKPVYLDVEDIGNSLQGQFVDAQYDPIRQIFKLYPWEDMLREDAAPALLTSDTRWIEPPWKAILSNKGFLPAIWHFNKGHPNLLPAFFEGSQEQAQIGTNHVRKPLFSREGANVTIRQDGKVTEQTEGEYGAEGYILQELAPLPRFGDNHTVIGSWIIGDQPAGLSIREDTSPVTRDLSRFLPHIIED